MSGKYPTIQDATSQALTLLEQALDLFDAANPEAFWHRLALERAAEHLDVLASLPDQPD